MTGQNVIHDQPGPTGAVAGDGDARLWGMTSAQRLERIFARVGLARGAFGPSVVVANAGWVFDESLIRALSRKLNTVLVDDEGRSVALHVPAAKAAAAIAAFGAGRPPALAGLTLLNAEELGGSYNSALRKREPPVLERLTAANVDAVDPSSVISSLRNTFTFAPSSAKYCTRL